MKPDICTSLTCSNQGSGYCKKCSHAMFFGEGVSPSGRKYRWEFNPMFGPLFVKTNGESLINQPSEKNKIWDVFAEWLKKRDEMIN